MPRLIRYHLAYEPHETTAFFGVAHVGIQCNKNPRKLAEFLIVIIVMTTFNSP